MLKWTVYCEKWDSLNWILMSDFTAIYKLSLLCEVKTINWGNFYDTKPLGLFLFLFCSEPIIKINVVPKFCLNPLDIRGIYINCLQKLFLLCVLSKDGIWEWKLFDRKSYIEKVTLLHFWVTMVKVCKIMSFLSEYKILVGKFH